MIRTTAVILLVVATTSVLITSGCFNIVYGQVLELDVDPPTQLLNGTSIPGETSIDIDPTETLPVNNGTISMSMGNATDTNMNDIPPIGVSVIISDDEVIVTNQEVTIATMTTTLTEDEEPEEEEEDEEE